MPLAVTSVAGHRVEALGASRARLMLTLDMRGVLIPVVATFYRGLTNRYLTLEVDGMKRAAETPIQVHGGGSGADTRI